MPSFKANEHLMVVHIDIWGPSLVNSNNGYKWYVSFVDEFSKYTWIYFFKGKGGY